MHKTAPPALSQQEEAPTRPHPAVLVVLALAGVMVLAVTLGLWHLRRDTLLLQTRSLASLASASADDLERGLQGVLLALQATRDDLREERLRPGHAETGPQLHRRVAVLTMVRKLWVIDTAGQVQAASSPAAMPAMASFQPPLDQLGGDTAALSEPFTDLASHETSVAVAMRFVRPGGGPGGWVVVAVPAASLLGAFGAAELAADARLAVFRADGIRLAGTLAAHPGAPAIDAAALHPSMPVQRLGDGSERLVQQRSVAALGLRLVLTRDLDAGLARWRRMAETAALGVAAVLAVVAMLLWRMLRAERQRELAQRHLHEEREHAALASAAAKEGHWDWDPRSARFYLSPRMKELLGLPRDSAAAQALPQAGSRLHPDDAAALQAALQRGLAPEAPPIDQVLRIRPSGEEPHDHGAPSRAVRLRGNAVLDAGGHTLRLAGVATDVTTELAHNAHTRRLEQALVRTQKLDALGTLAGGVAHDFNNILAAVVGYSEMARQAAPDGSPQARHLDQVLQAAQRGKSVIERILSFSRGGLRPARVFAVQPVVEQVLGLLAGSADARVAVARDIAAPPLHLRGDATALFEAVMNLCTNALQAMPAGGRLGVAVQAVDTVPGHWLSHGELAPGTYVRISVSDTGRGIEPEVMERLFEPFFTTRGQAGTGLGLAVVHGVAAEFGGQVDVSSTPGQGSRFTLWLPLAEEPEAAPGQAGMGGPFEPPHPG
jgi:signal transduction histidine kinase